jgi:hypothetical protein
VRRRRAHTYICGAVSTSACSACGRRGRARVRIITQARAHVCTHTCRLRVSPTRIVRASLCAHAQMAAFPDKRRWLFGVEGMTRNDPSRQQVYPRAALRARAPQLPSRARALTHTLAPGGWCATELMGVRRCGGVAGTGAGLQVVAS